MCVSETLELGCLHELVSHCLQIDVQNLTPPILCENCLPVPQEEFGYARPHIQSLHEGSFLAIDLQHPVIPTKFIICVPVSTAEAEQVGKKTLHGQSAIAIVPSKVHEGIVGPSTVGKHPHHLGKELSKQFGVGAGDDEGCLEPFSSPAALAEQQDLRGSLALAVAYH